jgi:Asp-tRNA(Asn)/Glu-tRNA(Gln) amidotransferase B subunit
MQSGKETLLQWFMGQVARATKGKTDPNVTKELLVKALEELINNALDNKKD